jgi:hypothetical protein
MAEAGREKVGDLFGTSCRAGKFVVSETGEAYDALANHSN